MKPVSIIPESKEHWLKMKSKVITSTESSTLYGLNKYQTMFELWHEKSGQIRIPFAESERMKWGNRLESSIAYAAAEENGWTIRNMNEFIYDEKLRIGSSFDFAILSEARPATINKKQTIDHDDIAILEIKNVDSLIYRNEWTEWEAPPHIELQLQHQMLISGLPEAYLVVLVGGNELKMIHRKANKKIHASILQKCEEFWKTIDAGEAPEPDFNVDSDTIIDLYKSTDGSSFDATDDEKIYDLTTRYKQAAEDEKDAMARKKAIKAEIFTLVGEAEKVYGSDFSISCKEREPYEVKAHTRQGFRDFRVTWKKEKK